MTAPDEAAAAELARLQAEAEAAEAALKLAQAKAALAAAQAEAARGGSTPPAAGPEEIHAAAEDPATATPQEDGSPQPADAAPASAPESVPATTGPLDADGIAAVVKGYTFEAETLDLGALMNTEPVPEAQIRIPLAMMNRPRAPARPARCRDSPSSSRRRACRCSPPTSRATCRAWRRRGSRARSS
jgi:hypothetical protein